MEHISCWSTLMMVIYYAEHKVHKKQNGIRNYLEQGLIFFA